MRRRRFRKPAVKLSLFPFLAVLICTMGALIVLLVTVVQQARVDARQVAEQTTSRQQQEAAEKREQFELEYQDALWEQDVLKQQRRQLTEQLANRRLQLSHLEDHIRRLESQWKQLQEEAKQLQQIASRAGGEAEIRQSELEQLQREIEQARARLESTRQQFAHQPRSYAIIPYEGPNGTRRRPIFIECTERGIVLQPEGILLGSDDFEGPLGPGNPLDAALRTVREYLARIGPQEDQGEPYPLLIVRPDGALAYAVARAAMKAWEDEFGYELVEAEADLEFPPADPVLANELRRAVEVARQRQAALAAAMPSEFPSHLRGGLVASPGHGGFVALAPNSGSGGGSGAGFRPPARESRPSAPSQTPRADGGQQHPSRSAADRTQPQEPQEGQTGVPGNGGSPPPLAAARGPNWALPNASQSATGITRPIQIACLRDQLVILPERGDSKEPQIIPLPQNMADVLDQFVAAIWQHVDSWGLAIVGGYWKPVLHVDVGTGAEPRFAELQRLMKDSGLEIERVRR